MAADVETSQHQQALGWLCEQYWHPLYFYVRRRGASPEESQDATQEFFAQLLASDKLALADPQRGRFRSFLLTAFRNFLINRHEGARALKRGGDWQRVPFDFDQAEAMYGGLAKREESPEAAFERRWAITVITRAIAALRLDWENTNKSVQFERLSPFLTLPIQKQNYEQLGDALNMSASAVKVMLHRMRRQLGEKIRAEVRATVDSEDELELELSEMLQVLGRSNM